MSLLGRLLGRREPEQRSGGFYGPSFSLGGGVGLITPTLAEGLSTVTACVEAISSGLSALPARVYKSEGDGRIEAPGHPVARLIRAPNPHQTWPDWVSWTMGQVLLYGNALSVIEYDGAGRPTALIPVPWQNIQVQLLPGGRLVYDVVLYTTPWGGTGLPRRFLQGQVWHLKERSDDGYIGRSRLARAPAVLEAALSLQAYSTAIWENAATPSGILTLGPGIKKEGKDRAEAHFNEQYTGTGNARRVLFMDKDSTWTSLSASPEDSEVLASRQFGVIELCRLLGTPPPIVQDYSHSTFTNAAQASIWWAVNTLQPYARRIEAEFDRTIFNDPAYHLEIDLSGLTRGSFETRWAANVAAVTAGILTVNDVRSQEGYAPLPDAPPPATTPPNAGPGATPPAA